VDAGLPCVDEQMKTGHAEYGTGKESVFGGNSLTSTEKADGWHVWRRLSDATEKRV